MIVVLDKLVYIYIYIYKGCLKETNLLRGISLDLSEGEGGRSGESVIRNTRPYSFVREWQRDTFLSLSLSGLLRNRFRIGYVYTPRGFLLRDLTT